LFVTDIYPAGEAPIPGITGERLARGIAEHGHHGVRHVADRSLLAAELARAARPGDVVIALGAGDINRILPQVAVEISARSGPSGAVE
jgi:UDP-N-acetylmuramate--alanine ligase